MTDMNRVRVALSGTAIAGPGVATFYGIGSAPTLVNALQALYNTLKGFMPITTHIVVPTEGEIVDSDTGATTGIWTGGVTAGLDGGDTGGFAKGVVARIVWGTAGITHNRHVKGSTFVVPLAGSAYDSDGTISNTNRGSMQTAIDTFHTATTGVHVIWTRPSSTTSGVPHDVTSATMSDVVTTLRSRRV